MVLPQFHKIIQQKNPYRPINLHGLFTIKFDVYKGGTYKALYSRKFVVTK